jgi:Recombination directionality factor-like
MRIVDLQRRLREIGRIRIGEQVPTQNGKTRPAKLETFRFTSRDRQVIEAAAAHWQGQVHEWAAPDGQQWQVITQTSEIPVVVPPGDMSFSQAYEQWSKGGCKVRCDGRWDHIADQACHCDPENRDCAIHTRLSVMVPELPGIGVWRLDTQGYYAAVELGGLVDICADASAQGRMLPARLRLEQRSIKRDGTTRRFAVPVLDLDIHPMNLNAGQLPATLTPVPQPTETERALIPSIRDQIGAVDTPATRESRQATLPPTGLKPRPATQFQGSGGADDREAPDDNNMTAPDSAVRVELDTPPEPANNSDGDGAGAVPARTVRDIAMKAGVVFRDDYEAAPHRQKTRTVERLRHALTYACTKGQHTSLNDLDTEQLARVWQRLEDIGAGQLTYRTDPTPIVGGVTFTSASGKETVVHWTDIEPGDPT